MAFTFQLKQQIKEGKPMIGPLITISAPEVTEIFAAAGFDWLFIDLEHSTLTIDAAQRLLQTAGTRCPSIIRAPCHDEAWIKKILDTGTAGILLPRVNTAEETARILHYCKYPPEGNRSVGLTRAHGFGQSFKEYVENANDDVAVFIQIEHIEGVNNIDEIVKVPGIDVIYIGPYDLSASMGKTGRVDDPEVRQQIERVKIAAVDAGIALGIFTANPADAPGFIQRGYTMINVGIDSMMLAQTAAQALETSKSMKKKFSV